MQNISEILDSVITNRTLSRLVLSRPRDKSIKKTTGTLFERAGSLHLQLETFLADGKAVHRNIPAAQAAAEVEKMLVGGYGQADVITPGGSLQIMISSKGKIHVSGSIGDGGGRREAQIGSHDREKSRFLDGSEPFLASLGISDKNGRVLDKKRAKFRQINRFVELLDDVYDKLPQTGVISVCDLCCGKGYLTFAVYHYLTALRGREVSMDGVDLKPDVVELCASIAGSLGYGGLRFSEGDIRRFEPPSPPDLVISLHACDTATDYALAAAVRQRAGLILSTPCCHHELMSSLDSPALGFIARYPILKQKMCDAATDSLRALRLETAGYELEAVELVDPDETPKNVMLRAVKRGISAARREALFSEYSAAVKLLGAEPLLGRLLDEAEEAGQKSAVSGAGGGPQIPKT